MDIVDRLLTENTMHSYYDSPAIQVEAAQEINKLRAENADLQNKLGTILAIIHRDGGQYQHQHGTETAMKHAEHLLYKWRTAYDPCR